MTHRVRAINLFTTSRAALRRKEESCKSPTKPQMIFRDPCSPVKTQTWLNHLAGIHNKRQKAKPVNVTVKGSFSLLFVRLCLSCLAV